MQFILSMLSMLKLSRVPPHTYSTCVLGPSVDKPRLTEWPLLPSKVFARLLLIANESSAHIADQC